MYLAITRPLGGIVKGIACAEGDMKGGETSAVINGWLVVEVKVLGEFEKTVDALLLGEDAMGLVRSAFFVPPASFFGAAVFLADVMELDGFWGTTIKLF